MGNKPAEGEYSVATDRPIRIKNVFLGITKVSCILGGLDAECSPARVRYFEEFQADNAVREMKNNILCRVNF